MIGFSKWAIEEFVLFVIIFLCGRLALLYLVFKPIYWILPMSVMHYFYMAAELGLLYFWGSRAYKSYRHMRDGGGDADGYAPYAEVTRDAQGAILTWNADLPGLRIFVDVGSKTVRLVGPNARVIDSRPAETQYGAQDVDETLSLEGISLESEEIQKQVLGGGGYDSEIRTGTAMVDGQVIAVSGTFWKPNGIGGVQTNDTGTFKVSIRHRPLEAVSGFRNGAWVTREADGQISKHGSVTRSFSIKGVIVMSGPVRRNRHYSLLKDWEPIAKIIADWNLELDARALAEAHAIKIQELDALEARRG